jgi:putative acetyltransferase
MLEPAIRPVRATDVPQVVELVRAVLGEFGLSFGVGSGTDDALLALPDSYDSQGGAFWVAEQGGEIIGTCGIAPLPDDSATYELRKMYLAPRARGAGVGRALLASALDFVRTKSAARVVLDTTHEMKDAIRFYERAGFVRDDAQIRGSRCSRGYVLELPK